MDLTLEDVRAFAEAHLIPLGFKLLVAAVIFIAGRQVAKLLSRALERVMDRSRVDVSLRKFLGDVAYAIMLVAVIIASLDAVGVKTTALIAVLGAAGLAIGLALQGSLANFAAGVMLILLRPYKVGDIVTVGKYLGRVDAIRVFQTILITDDYREVTIPNGQIIAQPIENLSALGRRRVDLVVTVTQTSDIGHVRDLLAGVVTEDARIHDEPAASIDIAEVSDAGVKLHLRPWTSTADYTNVAAETMSRIKRVLDGAQLKYSVSLQAVA